MAVPTKKPIPLITALLISQTAGKAPSHLPPNTPVLIPPAIPRSVVTGNTVMPIGAQPQAVQTISFPIPIIVTIAFAPSAATTEFPADSTAQTTPASSVVVPIYGSHLPSTVTSIIAQIPAAQTGVLTVGIIAKTTPVNLTDVQIPDYSTAIVMVTPRKIRACCSLQHALFLFIR